MEENKQFEEYEDFEAFLRESLPPEADPGLSRAVNPWRQSVTCILISLALGFLNLNFLYLNLLLPAVSFAFGLLGWYRLRGENRGFHRGWILILVRTGLFLLFTFQSMTIWSSEDLFRNSFTWILPMLFIFLQVAQLIQLREGIRLLQKKAGQPENVRAVNGLIGWDIVLCILAVISAQGIIVLIMATLLVYCLVCVYRLSQTLDEIGYALTPTPSRIGPYGMLGIYFGTLFLGCLFCFLLFSRLPMKWQGAEETRSPAAEEIAGQLHLLGFPPEMLADIAEEDLLRCKGAKAVMVQETNWYSSDADAFTMTGVAVVLSESPRIWKVFYGFSLSDQKNYWGTDALELRPGGMFGYGAAFTEEPSGRIFAENDGTTFAAPISYLKKETYTEQTSYSLFGGSSWSGESWFALFSWPHSFRNARGYVTLTVENPYQEIDFSWGINAEARIQERYSRGLRYAHQISLRQYPVLSAKNYLKQGEMFSAKAPFTLITPESWFFPKDSSPAEPAGERTD